MSKLKVSYSESDAYRQCALKHQLAYHERWRSEDTPAALQRGTDLHAVLEYHYGVLKKWDEAGRVPTDTPLLEMIRLHAVEKGILDQEGADEAVAWMYDGYADFYQYDSAWEILAVEVDFEIPLYDHTGAESRFILHGRIDLIVKNRGTGKIFVVDHKTCSNLPTEKALDFDEQMAMYTIAGRRMGHKIHGAVYNAIRSKKLVRPMTPSERFSRKVVTKTDAELAVVEHELVMTMEDAYRDRGGVDPPRSPDSDRCNWKCNFREACIMGRKMGPKRMRTFLSDTGFKQSDEAIKRQEAREVARSTDRPVQLDLVEEIAKVDRADAVEAATAYLDSDVEIDGDWYRRPGEAWHLIQERPPSAISQLAAS